MIVRYKRDVEMRHSANYTCGGITGHSRECVRSICRTIIHENCATDSVHLTEELMK